MLMSLRRARGGVILAALWALALLSWLAAYQAPLRLTLAVGGDPTSQRRSDDAPFLYGFHNSEPADRVSDPNDPSQSVWWWDALAASGGRPYRWATPQAEVRVPGAGGARYVVSALVGGPPGGTTSRWEAGPGLSYQLDLGEGTPRRYYLLAAPARNGDLRVQMTTPQFAAPGDVRELAFVLYSFRAMTADAPPRAPAWAQLGWLSLVLMSIYGWGWAAAGRNAAVSVGLLALGATGLSLAWYRTALTLFTPMLATLCGLAAGVTLAAWLGLRPRPRHPAAQAWVTLVGLVAAAWALRVAGMLHPHAIFSDTGLQANKLFEASLGRIFLSTGLPTEAGGGLQPYPPGPFLVLLPLTLIFPEDHWGRIVLVQVGTALLDSLVLVALALMLRQAGLSWRTALIGAGGYLIPITALESFTVGELANLGGQALALPLLTLLALGYAAPRLRSLGNSFADAGPQSHRGHRGFLYRIWTPIAHRRLSLSKPPLGSDPVALELQSHTSSALVPDHPAWPAGFGLVGLTAAMSVALLAHSGVTLSVGAVVAVAWGLAGLAFMRRRPGAIGLGRLSFATAGGLGLALILFYSAPIYVEALQARGGSERSGGMALGAIINQTVQGLLGIIPPGRRALAIPSLLSLLALAGLGLLGVQRAIQPQAAALRLTLAAWWLGTLLSQGLLLIAEQGLRWGHFLYPALCLSAAPLLSSYWRRGRAGRLVVGLSLAAIGVISLGRWIVHIRNYLH